jgi:sigma-E factor negative regulatory protein RseB
MNVAIESLNYHGTIVYLHDGRMESLRLIHRNDGQSESERVVHLTGVAREVLRENNVVRCFLPDSQSVVVSERHHVNRLIAKLDTANAEFEAHYQLQLHDDLQRVAGRDARVLRIDPKDGFRYGYRLWVDEQTGLLLRSELLGAQGDILEQFMFAQVDIVDSIPQAMLEPSDAALGKPWRTETSVAAPKQADRRWQVTSMPAGFNLLGHYNKQSPHSKARAEHLVVGDGLASVSVYIEAQNDQDPAVLGASKMGAVNMFGSVFGNHQLTVVGEVPEATIRMIADSVRYRLDQ